MPLPNLPNPVLASCGTTGPHIFHAETVDALKEAVESIRSYLHGNRDNEVTINSINPIQIKDGDNLTTQFIVLYTVDPKE